MKEIKKEIEELREEIKKYDISYGLSNPIISDAEYDKKYYKLIEIERLNPEFNNSNSPTQRIYSIEKNSKEDKIKHRMPMLSMDKADTFEEVDKFIKNMKNAIIENNILNSKLVLTNKFDGLTNVARYNSQLLKQGITRGDGYYGQNSTPALLNTQNLPKTISFNGELEFRGEAVIPYADFERININGEYKSVRNLASGTVAALKGSFAKDRNLQIYAFQLVEAEGMEFKSFLEEMIFMKELGIPTADTEVFDIMDDKDVKRLKKYLAEFPDKIRTNLPYQVDGVILEMDDLELREILGYAAKYPKWAIAYKFAPIDATSKIIDIDFNIGKTGIISITAIIEPVDIDGATIKRASLATQENINKRGIKLYDKVYVIKAKEVIPQITAPIIELRTGIEQDIILPTECPVCHTSLIMDGAYLKCPNMNCSGRNAGRIKHFTSREALNIDGLGEKTVEILLEKNIITSIIDIYHLDSQIDEMKLLEKFAQKKIDNLLKGIENSKKAPLSKVINGLTIDNIGENSSKELAKKYIKMENIIKSAENKSEFYKDIISMADFGEVSANSIVEYFSNPINIGLVKNLINVGFTMEEDVKEVNRDTIFASKTVVVTGTLKDYGRNEIKEKLESLGSKVSGSVSKKTDYVLYGENAGSKLEKAKEIGIKIISEEEFSNLISL